MMAASVPQQIQSFPAVAPPDGRFALPGACVEASRRDNSRSDVEGHAPEGSVTAVVRGWRERRPRDMEAAGSQRETEAGRPPAMARVMEQASRRVSQASDRIAGPTAARYRAGIEPGLRETFHHDGDFPIGQRAARLLLERRDAAPSWSAQADMHSSVQSRLRTHPSSCRQQSCLATDCGRPATHVLAGRPLLSRSSLHHARASLHCELRVLRNGVRSWVSVYRGLDIAPAKSLQDSAVSQLSEHRFPSLQRRLRNPANGSRALANRYSRRSPRPSSITSPASLSDPVTNGFGASSIHRHARSSAFFGAIKAGASSNGSCAIANSHGGVTLSTPVSAPWLTRRGANNSNSISDEVLTQYEGSFR